LEKPLQNFDTNPGDFDPSQMHHGKWWFIEINILPLIRWIRDFLKRRKGYEQD